MVIGAVHSSTLLELVGADGEDEDENEEEDDGIELLELLEHVVLHCGLLMCSSVVSFSCGLPLGLVSSMCNLLGTHPHRLFSWSVIVATLGMSPHSGGIVPVSSLLFRRRLTRLFIVLHLAGSVPVMWLLFRYKLTSFGKQLA